MNDSRGSSRYIVPALVACTLAGSAQGAELTIGRLFDAPALAGPTITGMKISPEGSRITFLKGKADNKDRLDLWEFDIRNGGSRILVDSNELAAANKPLTDEERNRRERQRTAALSGIIEYSFAPKGDALLFPLNGELYYYRLASGQQKATIDSIPSGTATDANVSPDGKYVSYVRDQNLWLYDLAAKKESALTRDGGGAIKNGMAEFVAQEEMGRSTGYWWSPDEKHIAFARVDESPVKLVQRFEIAADNVATFEQRYPAAGEPNVKVQLGVADVATGAVIWIDLGQNADIYLARVNWLPDGRTLAVQRESRDQKRLDLLFADITTGKSRPILTESSDTWIELNDELTFLRRAKQFIWASNRDGYTHLYLYDDDGKLVRRLTEGAWVVDDFRDRAIKAVDEKHGFVYFSANEKSPLERQLYRASLHSTNPRSVERITKEDGIHKITMPAGAAFYIDKFTSVTQPSQVSLRSPDGSLRAWLLENKLDASHPDAPYLADNSIAEFGKLEAADGQDLYYRLFKPAHFDAGRKYPAIVQVYGGPGVQSVQDKWQGDSFEQILTRAGFVVFQLDNRGSAFRGTAFQAPIYKKLGEVEVADQVLGAKWLGSQSFVDASRMGVWGWSYGGYMTLMLAFKAPEVFKAAVSGAPVTDWTLYDTHYTERYLDTPQSNGAGYELSGVLPYAEHLKAKLLLMHGMSDDNVLFLNSTKLYRRLQDLTKPFDVMVYPGSKHGLLRQHDGRHGYAMILKFFDDHLKN